MMGTALPPDAQIIQTQQKSTMNSFTWILFYEAKYACFSRLPNPTNVRNDIRKRHHQKEEYGEIYTSTPLSEDPSSQRKIPNATIEREPERTEIIHCATKHLWSAPDETQQLRKTNVHLTQQNRTKQNQTKQKRTKQKRTKYIHNKNCVRYIQQF